MKKQQLKNLIKQEIQNIEEIRNKDGIIVFRLLIKNKSYVLKYFEKEEYAREIEIYKLFQNIGIQTLKTFQFGTNFILMEDVNVSKKYHLALPEDLKDDETIKNLATWYKNLHKKGELVDFDGFYCENDLITTSNIKSLGKILSQKIINLILSFWEEIEKAKLLPTYTLTYNDFASENLIAGKTCAFMYDYNLVGKGLAFSDIQNVLCMLDEKRKQVFLNFYGKTLDDFGLEKQIYNVFSPLISIIIARKREVMPSWAQQTLKHLKSPEFAKNLENLQKLV